jgi:hypothetical protein
MTESGRYNRDREREEERWNEEKGRGGVMERMTDEGTKTRDKCIRRDT